MHFLRIWLQIIGDGFAVESSDETMYAFDASAVLLNLTYLCILPRALVANGCVYCLMIKFLLLPSNGSFVGQNFPRYLQLIALAHAYLSGATGLRCNHSGYCRIVRNYFSKNLGRPIPTLSEK